MTVVAAGRWDIEWDRGGAWFVRLGRRDREGAAVPIGGPLLLELRDVDAPSTSPARLVLTGRVDDDGAGGDLSATRAQIEALPGARYEHRILALDAPRGLPMVWLRGYVSLRDTVSDD
jgi:hypothetical protein